MNVDAEYKPMVISKEGCDYKNGFNEWGAFLAGTIAGKGFCNGYNGDYNGKGNYADVLVDAIANKSAVASNTLSLGQQIAETSANTVQTIMSESSTLSKTITDGNANINTNLCNIAMQQAVGFKDVEKTALETRHILDKSICETNHNIDKSTSAILQNCDKNTFALSNQMSAGFCQTQKEMSQGFCETQKLIQEKFCALNDRMSAEKIQEQTIEISRLKAELREKDNCDNITNRIIASGNNVNIGSGTQTITALVDEIAQLKQAMRFLTSSMTIKTAA